MTVASLAMYPFAEARPAVEELWDSVRARLPFDAPRLEWGLEHLDACRSPDLLVAQTCGWPVATVLGDAVRVFGTFDHDLERAVGGTYRSVLVSRHDRPLAATLADPDLVVAANAADSLSGWVSLRVVGEAAGVRFERVRFTGAHAASVAALLAGQADVASIDSVSWTYLADPRLHVVGDGPQVPCLPLVAARAASDALIAELRGAFAAAVADPANTGSCAALRIRGFLARDNRDYEGLSALVELG